MPRLGEVMMDVWDLKGYKSTSQSLLCMQSIRCTLCGMRKRREDFHVDRRTRTGVNSNCKECKKKRRGPVKMKRERHRVESSLPEGLTTNLTTGVVG